MVDPPPNAEAGDFDPTPRESVASQSSEQLGEVASPSLQAPKAATPSPASTQKRTRGFGKKSKSPAPMQSDDQMSPGFASKTLSGSAKGVSSLSGEGKNRKEQERGQFFPQANKTWMSRLPE